MVMFLSFSSPLISFSSIHLFSISSCLQHCFKNPPSDHQSKGLALSLSHFLHLALFAFFPSSPLHHFSLSVSLSSLPLALSLPLPLPLSLLSLFLSLFLSLSCTLRYVFLFISLSLSSPLSPLSLSSFPSSFSLLSSLCYAYLFISPSLFSSLPSVSLSLSL